MSGRTKVALLGDAAFFGRFCIERSIDIRRYFEAMAEYLSGFDLVVANLETPFTKADKAEGAKSAYIQANPKNAALLASLGIHAVNLANNHIFDFGKPGLDETIDSLSKVGVKYFGVNGKSLAVDLPGVGLDFIGGCSFNTNPLGVSSRGVGRGPVAALDPVVAKQQIKLSAAQGRVCVLSAHSGVEHVNFPSLEDIAIARSLAKEAPYIYYGHHPHVVQGVEQVGTSVIAYSLGNFCFDDVYTPKSSAPLIKQSDNNKTGMVLELEFEEGGLASWSTRGFFLGDDSLAMDPPGFGSLLSGLNAALTMGDDEYIKMRSGLIAEYTQARRQLRDLNWYLKRIRFSSVELIIRAEINKRLHRRMVQGMVQSRLR